MSAFGLVVQHEKASILQTWKIRRSRLKSASFHTLIQCPTSLPRPRCISFHLGARLFHERRVPLTTGPSLSSQPPHPTGEVASDSSSSVSSGGTKDAKPIGRPSGSGRLERREVNEATALGCRNQGKTGKKTANLEGAGISELGPVTLAEVLKNPPPKVVSCSKKKNRCRWILGRLLRSLKEIFNWILFCCMCIYSQLINPGPPKCRPQKEDEDRRHLSLFAPEKSRRM